jgi:hypothetical protein
MIASADNKDIYEDFEPSKDTFFFKVGSGGLISFHGKNYNITKKLSADQKHSLIQDAAFVRISSNCYVNVDKISSLEKDHIRFVEHVSGSKIISVPIWKKSTLQQRLSERHASGIH